MSSATRIIWPKNPGVALGQLAGEDGTKLVWSCDNMECNFFTRLDLPAMVDAHGADTEVDAAIDVDAPCPDCGGFGHMTVYRKPDPEKDAKVAYWYMGGMLAGAALMFWGAFYNFEQMTSGGRFRPYQLIVCIPIGLALAYFAWEIWKGTRNDLAKHRSTPP